VRVTWRRGLSGLSPGERLVALDAESRARERAFGEAYQAKCDRLGAFIVDCSELLIRSTTVQHCRKDGYLYLRISVYFAAASVPRVFLWRTSVRRRASRSSA
jgi:hypothetical protein